MSSPVRRHRSRDPAHWWRSVAVAAALIAIAVPALSIACGESEPAKIGTLLDSTGDVGASGSPTQAAVDLAIELVNEAGGVNGNELLVVHRDSGSSQQLATDAADMLVDVDGVGSIVGLVSSGATIGIARSATVPNKALMISAASTSPELTTLDDDDYLFRTAVSDALQGIVLAQVARQLGYGNVATMYINDSYGIGLSDTFTDAFARLGGIVSEAVPVEAGGGSYRSELQRAAGNGAVALVVIANPDVAGVFLREAAETGIFTRYLFADGARDQQMFDEIGSDIFNGSYGTATGPPPLNEELAAFRELYRTRTTGDVDARFVAEAFDATMLLALAIERAGSDRGLAVREVIREVANPPGIKVGPGEVERALELVRQGSDIDYVGAAGDQDLDDNGDVVNDIEVWRMVDGQVTSTVDWVTPGNAVNFDR